MGPAKTAVVTGAASGIGSEVATLLVERGTKVVGLDRDSSVPPGVEWHPIDLASPDAIATAAESLPDHVDILCNIAGTHPRSAEGNEIIRVNYVGTRLLTELTIEHMQPGALVINMASATASDWLDRLDHHRELIACADFASAIAWLEAHPVPRETGYSVSKELLIAWGVLAAADWIDRGIRVNAVVPGPVETPQYLAVRERWGDAPHPDFDRVGRAASPGEVAAAVALLCDDDASWINGAVIPLDGGLSATYIADGEKRQPL